MTLKGVYGPYTILGLQSDRVECPNFLGDLVLKVLESGTLSSKKFLGTPRHSQSWLHALCLHVRALCRLRLCSSRLS